MLWWSQVKIARALSVSEGKGLVSWVASQSIDGTVSRGNVLAWLSGPEKSRHLRHDGSNGVTGTEGKDPGRGDLGFVARIFDKSGREDRGTGGGVALCLNPLELPFTGCDPERGTGLAGAEGMPLGGNLRSGILGSDSLDWSLANGLCGSVGVLGGGKTSVVVTEGVDLAPFSIIFAPSVSFSWFDLLGGKGGRLEGS